MNYSNTEPANELSLILNTKRNQPSQTFDVVNSATHWMCAQLTNTGTDYECQACEDKEHYGHSAITLQRQSQTTPVSLEIKIAEIQNKPYAFAEVLVQGKTKERLFPFFGEISTENGQVLLLHYVADFILSTTAK